MRFKLVDLMKQNQNIQKTMWDKKLNNLKVYKPSNMRINWKFLISKKICRQNLNMFKVCLSNSKNK